MNKSDFLVIGAGMAGASAAYELAGSNGVTVLDRWSLNMGEPQKYLQP